MAPEDDSSGPTGHSPNTKRWFSELKHNNRDLAIGLQVGISIVFFSLGGYSIDRTCGTSPLFFIIGIVMGMIGMFVLLLSPVHPQKPRKNKGNDDTKPR